MFTNNNIQTSAGWTALVSAGTMIYSGVKYLDPFAGNNKCQIFFSNVMKDCVQQLKIGRHKDYPNTGIYMLKGESYTHAGGGLYNELVQNKEEICQTFIENEYKDAYNKCASLNDFYLPILAVAAAVCVVSTAIFVYSSCRANNDMRASHRIPARRRQ